MNISVTIGKNLRAYRKMRGMTQQKLSELSGVHRTTLGAIERGVKNPRSETLQLLADALDIAVMQLLAEFDESGCLIIDRSTKPLREAGTGSQEPRRSRGREKKTSSDSGQSQVAYGIIAWNGNILHNVDVKQEEEDIALQTLHNLIERAKPGEDPIERFNKVYPKVKAAYRAR